MAAVPDEKLYAYADRLKDKVVVITGAANGIGKEAALQFAKYGAKVVIGDRDIEGGEQTAQAVKAAGGLAIATKCDVTNWDDQVQLFELAIATYGAVDIVVPNAGVTEGVPFDAVKLVDGLPIKPKLTTLDVNLTGVVYYTNIVPVPIKLLLAGIPKAPVPRIAGAILHAASNPSVESNGSAWLLTDNGPVFQVPKEQFKEGVYEMIDARANRLLKGGQGIAFYLNFVRDIGRIFGKQLAILGVGAILAKLAYNNRDTLTKLLK
ncbi:hypothetical protein CCMSSC00406_0003916 [Pleurotus cornucopiae]|uniref:Uncharacterized protein n=1 Tax=Pleurotus cornucopiae TaxID=5321 RepID=A0ACB7IQQ5_PLECO|nr:hypothetical protein CCMSSC00406_0003916 [Pleurotus cornucopiae]